MHVAERHVIGRRGQIGKAEDHDSAVRRTVDQSNGRLDDRDARALGADQRAGDVEAVLGQ